LTRPTAAIARHAAAYATGSVVGGITRAVLLPVIARTLSAEEFGVLSLLLAATNLLHLVFELGLVTALIKFHSETHDLDERKRLRSTVFLLMPLLDLIVAGPLLLGRTFLSQVLFGTGVHAALVAVAVAIAFFAAQFQLFLGHLRADDRSREFALLMAAKGAITLSVTLFLVFALDRGVSGFLLGNLAGSAAVTVVAVPRRFVRHGVDLTGARDRLRRMLRFGVPLVPAALGLWALGNLDSWLLRVLADLRAVGVYGFGSEICLPIALLLASINLAWPSFAFSRARADGGAEEVARVFRHLFVVLVGGALAVAALRREILLVLGTDTYAAAARVIPPLALATCIYGAAQAFGTGLQVAGDTRRLPLLVLVAVAANAGLNVLAIPVWREVGAAWVTVGTNSVLAALILRESHRQFRIPFEVGRLVRVVLAAAAALVVADRTAGLPLPAGAAARLVVVALFPPALVVAGAVSAAELRALPRVAREILTRRTA
jgi:O-antigen/teichoic acid export membrane protein